MTDHLVIVAHQDDELYFISPDIITDLDDDIDYTVVYLTAGDAGNPDAEYWQDRELGVQAAFSSMADIGSWNTDTATFGGVTVAVAYAGNVTHVYLRLPDGGMSGEGNSSTGNESLRKLWEGSISSITSVDESNTFTKQQLLDFIKAVADHVLPATIRTLDGLGHTSSDHSDHVIAGRLAVSALAGRGAPIVAYRGYSISGLDENVDGSLEARKLAALEAYIPFDSAGPIESAWVPRMYTTDLSGPYEPVAGPGGGDNLAMSASVLVSSQNAADGQTAAKAIDGVVDGYPGDHTHEWASLGDGVGSWIELRWDTPQIIRKVSLYGRAVDTISSGTLTFSSGDPKTVGAVPSTGVDVYLEERTVTWVRFTVTGGSGNTGLREIKVFAPPVVPWIVATPATGGRSEAGSFSITPPAGAGGYFALAGFVVGQAVSGPLTPPSGWTLHDEFFSFHNMTWSRWQSWIGTESAGSSWTFNTSGNPVESVAMVIIPLSDPVAVNTYNVSYHNSTSSNTFSETSPTVTTTAPSLIVHGVTGNPYRETLTELIVTYPTLSTLGRQTSLSIAADNQNASCSVVAAVEQPTAGGSAGGVLWHISPAGPGAGFFGMAAPVAFTFALEIPNPPRTADGALSLSGTTTHAVRVTRTATGTLSLNGTAESANALLRTASGAATLSGSATASIAEPLLPEVYGHTTGSGSPTAEVPVPAGVGEGSLLVAWTTAIWSGGTPTSGNLTGPAGWTQASFLAQADGDTQVASAWWYKYAEEADVGTYDFTQTPPAGQSAWGISASVFLIVNGPANGNPFDTTPATSTPPDPQTIAPYTPNTDNSLALAHAIAYFNPLPISISEGWSLIGEQWDDENSHRLAQWSREADAVSFGPTTFDASGDGGSGLASIAVVKPGYGTLNEIRFAAGSLTLTGSAVGKPAHTRTAAGTLTASGEGQLATGGFEREADAELSIVGSADGEAGGPGITQSASGTFTWPTVNVTLPAPAAEASRVAVVIFGDITDITPPFGWTLRASEVDWVGHYLFDGPSGGESSWEFTGDTESGGGTWVALEIPGGSFDTAPDGQHSTSSGGSYSVENVTPSAGERVVIASIGSYANGAPLTISGWSGNFIEAEDVGSTSSGNPAQSVATRFAAATGDTPYSTTASFSASSTYRSALSAAYSTTADVHIKTAAGTLALDGEAAATASGWNTWRHAITDAAAGVRAAKVLVIGDSWMGHSGPGSRAGMWPVQLLGLTRSRYDLAGSGSGLILPQYSNYLSPANASTGTGQYFNYIAGQGKLAVLLDDDEYVQWASLSMSSFDIVYTGYTGDLLVEVDSVSVGTIDASATALAGRIAHFDVADGTHTVRVTAVDGGGVVEGIVAYNDDEIGGITYWDCTHAGYESDDFGEEQSEGWANYEPDLVIWGMYGNNWMNNGRSPALAAADFLEDIASIGGAPTVIVMHSAEMSGFPFDEENGSGYTVQDYIDAINAAAESVGGTALNLQTYYNVDWEASDWLTDDDAHPNPTGHTKIAEAFDEFLAAGINISEIAQRTASSALTLSGSATESSHEVREADGALALTGNADSAALEVRAALGELTLSGTGTAAAQEVRAADGSLTLTGVAEPLGTLTRTAAGSLTLEGTAAALTRVARGADGELNLAGAAGTAIALAAGGALTLLGSADNSSTLVRTAAAELTLSASADAEIRLARSALGSISLTGTAAHVLRLTRTATAELLLTGTTDTTAQLTRTAEGSLSLSGTASGTSAVERTADGALTLTADGEQVVGLRADTVLTLVGIGTTSIKAQSAAEATLLLTGAATASVRAFTLAHGMMTLTGDALVHGGASWAHERLNLEISVAQYGLEIQW